MVLGLSNSLAGISPDSELVFYTTPRHAEKSCRPTFTRLLQALSSPVTDLLRLSEEDARVHPQSAVLGAPLETSKDVYPELQGTYMHDYS